MASLSAHLSSIFENAFNALNLPTTHAQVKRGAVGQNTQFQCNGAMPCAKIAKKNPRQVAEDIIAEVKKSDSAHIFENLSVGGPGFINITMTDTFLSAFLIGISNDENCGVKITEKPETIILDYGGPNIAKAMHVGHLRSSIIGDAMRRVYSFCGHNTIGDVHLGDWGTPMGMIISELEIMGHTGEITMDMLAEIYPKAAAACKEDPKRMEQARAATKKLQDGNPEYTKIWRNFIDVSITGMKKNFDALNVHFDEWKGESDAHPYIDDMVQDAKTSNIAREDDGALIINVAKEGDKKEIPPLLLLKSDGAVLYGTTDLATIINRVKTHNPDHIVYIVDQRQHQHFEQVFRAAERLDIVSEDKPELTFAGFGTMNGTDGKPFKTRAGGVMRLEDLIQMATDKAKARLKDADLAQDMDEAEQEDVAKKVGLAALKFADLQNNRVSDYIFDLDRMTAFEGKTGPYLLYQAVRIQSLLKKAEIQDDIEIETLKIQDGERDLALLLTEMDDALKGTLNNIAPHILCDYTYSLAQTFSSFYGNCPVMSEEDEGLRLTRLKLCQQTHKHLKKSLELLGIEIPKRM